VHRGKEPYIILPRGNVKSRVTSKGTLGPRKKEGKNNANWDYCTRESRVQDRGNTRVKWGKDGRGDKTPSTW